MTYSLSDNYPPGAANDPNAPYNQPADPDPIDVTAGITVTLVKDEIELSADNPIINEYDDWDSDDEGGYIHTGGREVDFSECDFKKDYKENHYSITDLLEEYSKILLQQLLEERKRLSFAKEAYNRTKDSKDYNHAKSVREWYCKCISNVNTLEQKIADCEGWTEEDVDIYDIEKQ